MLLTKKKMKYKAFGLSIISEIPLPELLKMDFYMSDVEIRIGELTKNWKGLSGKPFDFVIDINLVMFQIPSVGIFSIEDGKVITVSPAKDADEDIIKIFILGTCMGAVLMQKQIFPLHGSAIAIDGKAYAIVGDSGAGKSTLASAFLKEGYKLLSDDVIAVSFSKDDKKVLVTPSYPQQKLWKDSLTSLGMKISDYQSIYGRENKFCVPISTLFSTETLPLGGIFELVKTENSEVDIHPIHNLDRFNTLFLHTYRNFFIQRLGLMEWHLNLSANIIESIEIYRLQRPKTGISTSMLVSAILNTINKETER